MSESDTETTNNEEPEPPEKQKSPDESSTKIPNGIKKNGLLPQQNGNTVISREEKFILVPEPSTLPSKDEESNEVKVLDEENKTEETKVKYV